MRRRGRSGRRRRFKRRARRGGRIGRSRSRVIVGVWSLDGGVNVGQYLPGALTNANPTGYSQNISGVLPMQSVSGANINALVYCFDPSLAVLSAGSPGYAAIAGMHDQVKLLGFRLRFISNVNPRSVMSIPIPVSNPLDMTGVPDYMPDVTWIDYDGIAPIRTGSGAGQIGIPADGDVTSFVGNFYRRRFHKAYSSFSVSMRPRSIVPVSQAVVNPSSAGAFSYAVSNFNPWQSAFNAGVFVGRIYLAVSYKGPQNTVNLQPQVMYGFRASYKVALRSPLWG